MAGDKKIPGKAKSEPVKDLEGLSDADLDDVSGGACEGHCGMACCKTCAGGGGGCGGTAGTAHEANIKGAELGDVELSPTKTTTDKTEIKR